MTLLGMVGSISMITNIRFTIGYLGEDVSPTKRAARGAVR